MPSFQQKTSILKILIGKSGEQTLTEKQKNQKERRKKKGEEILHIKDSNKVYIFFKEKDYMPNIGGIDLPSLHVEVEDMAEYIEKYGENDERIFFVKNVNNDTNGLTIETLQEEGGNYLIENSDEEFSDIVINALAAYRKAKQIFESQL